MTKLRNGVVGFLLGAAGDAILIWQRLLIYTEATGRPLVAGGTFGLIVGTTVALVTPIYKKKTTRNAVITVGLMGLLSLAGFNAIVYGEESFTGRAAVLYLLPFLTAFSLSFIATVALEIISRNRAKP